MSIIHHAYIMWFAVAIITCSRHINKFASVSFFEFRPGKFEQKYNTYSRSWSFARRLSTFSNILALTQEQREAILSLLEDIKNVVTILLTGFGESLVYKLFLLVKLQNRQKISNFAVLKSIRNNQITQHLTIDLSSNFNRVRHV